MVNNDILPVLGEYEGERIILLEFPHSLSLQVVRI